MAEPTDKTKMLPFAPCASASDQPGLSPFAPRKDELARSERRPVEIHPALAEALRADRESFNQRFALRQRAGARIDASAFQYHLRTTLNDIVHAVGKAQAERVRAVVNALFDVSLDLFAADLLGPKTKHPHVGAVWRDVLPYAARLLAREPIKVAGSLSNAADHLAGYPAARPAEWIGGMRGLSCQCDSVAQWLDIGKVLAWRAGMAQYRTPALEIARALPWKLAAQCFAMPKDVTESDWQKLLDRLKADRWCAPSAPPAETALRPLRIVRTTGGFRGFGGPCLRPPTVTATDQGLFVVDGNDAWQLWADAFGTFWQRVPPAAAKSKVVGNRPQVALDKHGNITWDGSHHFSELADASSYACDGQTLAVTLPTSYHVFLLARAT